MFKEIIESEKRKTLLHDATFEVLDMLGRAGTMCDIACNALLRSDIDIDAVVRDDREINEAERHVRKMVFEHLSINPNHDLYTSLSLISIVHDIERCGDYSKSLVEISGWTGDKNFPSSYEKAYIELGSLVAPLFALTEKALRESQIEIARQVMREHEIVKVRTDELIRSIMMDTDSGGKLVTLALAVRFLRRISAHLSNVASSMTNPFDRVAGKEV